MPYRTILIDIPHLDIHAGGPSGRTEIDFGNLLLQETGVQAIDGELRYYYAATSPLLLLIVTRNGLQITDFSPGLQHYVSALIGWDDGTGPYVLPEHTGKKHSKVTILNIVSPTPDATPLPSLLQDVPRLGQRGGNRPGSGRPRLGDERMDSYDVTLPQRMAVWLRSLGKDNISAGVREAARRAGYTEDHTP